MTFSISLLELYISDGHMALESLPPIDINGEEEYELGKIMKSKYRFGTLRFCIKYKGYLAEQSK